MAPDPLRVVFCHYTSDVCGGSDRALYDLVAHLDRERFTPLMLLKAGDPMAATYAALGIEVFALPFVSPRRALEWRKLLAFFLFFWPHTLRAALRIRTWRADLVHVNTSNNLQGAFAARIARKPLVWHVRELVPGSRLGALMRGMVPRLATRAIAISGAVAEGLAQCGAGLRTVFDGIDLSACLEAEATGAIRNELGIPPAAPIVTCIGRLEPWKGQHVLIEAVPALVEARADIHVLIVGGPAVNKPEYAARLEDRCRALGVARSVHFTGIRHDVPAILAESTVLALPSVTPEPFGLTVVEAMAAGRPVVATAAGGPLDTVEDSVTGTLVPSDDPASLAAALLAIIGAPEVADRMGEAGRKRALERYTIDRLVADMATIFEETATREPR